MSNTHDEISKGVRGVPVARTATGPAKLSDGVQRPLEPNMIQRAMQALRYAFSGEAPNVAWQGPLEPIAPVVAPEQAASVRGRALDYAAGQNLKQRPRADEGVTYEMMRNLADSCDVLRLVIETRKDQMDSQSFSVVPIDETQKPDARCKEVEDFFKLPDGEHEFSTWQRMILEDMFVLDAVAIYPWLRNDGSLYRLDIMDAATIKRVINEAGRTPVPPDPAYQQVLKGVPVSDYTSDELIYAIRNRRSHRLYGYSPVEQIIMTVNTAIRRSLHQLQFYTEGSTPDLLFSCPSDWNMDQVRDFNDWWQDQLAGNTLARRRGTFVPGGIAPLNTKDGALKDGYDEWLARIVCYAFSVSPTPFVAQVNRATAESAQEAALMEGLHPVLKWMKSLLDRILWKYFGYTDLQIKWDENKSIDPQVQAQIDDMCIRNGSRTINEARQARGEEPIDGGDEPLVYLPTGPVELAAVVKANTEAALNPPPPPPMLAAGGLGGEPPSGKPKKPTGNQTETQSVSGGEQPANSGATAKAVDGGAIAKKAPAGVSRIDRERPAVLKAQKAMLKVAKRHLASARKTLIAQAKHGMDVHGRVRPVSPELLGKAERDDEMQQMVQRILDQLNMDSAFEGMDDDMREVMETILRDAGVQALTQLGIETGTDEAMALVNDGAVAFAEKRAAELVQQISEATREMLRSDIEDALTEGWSNDRLASELEDNYGFSDSRAETIARTETAFADVQGNLMAYAESGVVASKRWITGEGCCELCDELDGEEVGLDEQFDFDGDKIDGPPGHPRCRCDVVPVLADDSEDDGAAVESGDTVEAAERGGYLGKALKKRRLQECCA